MVHYKYPRSQHLPWSPGATSDDKVLSDVSHFEGQEVVITEKMDGENTSLYSNYTHARSLTSGDHESRHWLKRFHASLCGLIPEDMRVCGENLYARHTIGYDALPSYFLGFSMWYEDECLSWDETMEWFELIGITPVKVLYRGVWDEKKVREIIAGLDLNRQEGVVVRITGGFKLEDFGKSLAKWVRKGHVEEGNDHWMHQAVIPNGLAGE